MKNNTESRTACLRWVAIAALTIPFLLLCSCSSTSSTSSHKYNYGYPGDSRPADEAILTGHQTYDPKVNTLGSPLISKLDDHSCSIMPADWSGRGPIGTNSFEIRLLPGNHKLQVEPFLNGNVAPRKGRSITFDAIAGNHYDLTLHIFDVKVRLGVKLKWDAKIVEIETGREFRLDAP
jgi:hypothetical protein